MDIMKSRGSSLYFLPSYATKVLSLKYFHTYLTQYKVTSTVRNMISVCQFIDIKKSAEYISYTEQQTLNRFIARSWLKYNITFVKLFNFPRWLNMIEN